MVYGVTLTMQGYLSKCLCPTVYPVDKLQGKGREEANFHVICAKRLGHSLPTTHQVQEFLTGERSY